MQLFRFTVNEAAVTDASPDLEHIFLHSIPLLDVRAPVEVAKGSFPAATNIPLLDDQQRHDIGLRYAEQGQDAAIALGLEMATPTIREQRLTAWNDFIREHPDGYLFCFRGGLRSRTTQQWLQDAGVDYPLIPGGYKAMRRFLLERMYRLIAEGRIQVVSAPTGSGKTELIHAWPQSIDLEGLANHKGSAFGKAFTPQPSQIDWEHQFTIDWMHLRQATASPVLMEDESRLIGQVFLPPELQTLLASAPELRLQASLDERVQRLRRDYVQPIREHYQTTDPEQCAQHFTEHVQHNIGRIRKRLGGARHAAMHDAVPDAVQALLAHNDWAGFDSLIRQLLTDYYDPMYAYQQSRSSRPCAASGNHDELLHWLQHRS